MVTGATTPNRETLTVGSVGGTSTPPQGSPDGALGATPVAGALTNELPITDTTETAAGGRAFTFFDDYYNRVHVVPSVVDFGAISADEAQPIALWNARLSPVNLTDIDLDDTDQGVTLSGPSLPRTLGALGTATYSAIAARTGESSILLHGTFAFNNGEAPTVTIIGSRSALVPFTPNWRDQYSLRLEFKTDIFTSRSGKEQRRAIRDTARRQYSYTVTAGGKEMRSLDRFITRWQARPVLVGDMLRTVHAVSGMPVNGRTLEVEAVPEWLVVGAAVVLVDNGRQAQRKITAIADNLLTFSLESPDEWSAATTVHPAMLGRMDSELQVNMLTDSVGELSFNFAAEPGVHFDDIGSPDDVFNGREILTVPHNWMGGLNGSYQHQVDTLDYGYGRTHTVSPIAFATRFSRLKFTLGMHADVARLTTFFCRQRGQQGEFYVSTGGNDLPLSVAASAGDTELVFDDPEIYESYQGDTVHRAVMIAPHGWDYPVARQIVDIISTGDGTLIELAEPLPFDLVPGQVAISWLRVHRFATDLLELRAITDRVAECEAAVKSLEDLAVDVASPWAGLDAGAQWLVDYYGWNFSHNVLINPLHDWVHREYPLTAEESIFETGAYWLNRHYGQPYATTEVANPVYELVNVTYPDYFPEN